MKAKADEKRQLILGTAKQIILDNGLQSLTLDAIAKKASISKGGLLYHFPNKKSLIEGLAQHIFDDFAFHFYNAAEKDPNETGKWSRALIEATKIDIEQNAELNVGILAASFLEPEITENISESYVDLLKKLEGDKINPITTDIIRFALDGIYYSKMFNVASLEKEKVDHVMQQLWEMTKREG
ncbi:TetR/AcrR family transcriptional regulator [Salirhabdus salicampi]|uniref:TetR/AcrR family transcriptional regulator n=1 Tax=Salirhabdus salicampi TaxID=476102 RepID=UPI0020C3AF5D|nr:TetR/AcrR family transcriptional regulator [Salirhabdus salicampi]MCP8617241.1 TetR/AcrR family transcriptional regulator [Salirhabdus salicampi]